MIYFCSATVALHRRNIEKQDRRPQTAPNKIVPVQSDGGQAQINHKQTMGGTKGGARGGVQTKWGSGDEDAEGAHAGGREGSSCKCLGRCRV